jgi:hypothetical protein
MRISRLLLACALALLPSLVYVACEISSATQEVVVSPSSAALKKGESIQFTASGGFEYRWHLENEKWGMLSTRRGSTTVYTSLYDPRDAAGATAEGTVLQVLYAESYIPAAMSQQGASGRVDVLTVGEAYITHLSECDVECTDYTNKQ